MEKFLYHYFFLSEPDLHYKDAKATSKPLLRLGGCEFFCNMGLTVPFHGSILCAVLFSLGRAKTFFILRISCIQLNILGESFYTCPTFLIYVVVLYTVLSAMFIMILCRPVGFAACLMKRGLD